jgi:hypothetical protein
MGVGLGALMMVVFLAHLHDSCWHTDPTIGSWTGTREWLEARCAGIG